MEYSLRFDPSDAIIHWHFRSVLAPMNDKGLQNRSYISRRLLFSHVRRIPFHTIRNTRSIIGMTIPFTIPLFLMTKMRV